MVTNSDNRFPVGAAYRRGIPPQRIYGVHEGALRARDNRSIKNATEAQLTKRELDLAALRSAGICWVKLYSNMSEGRLRVKLYGVYRQLGAEGSFLRLTEEQRGVLMVQGYKIVYTPTGNVDSYSRYIA